MSYPTKIGNWAMRGAMCFTVFAISATSVSAPAGDTNRAAPSKTAQPHCPPSNARSSSRSSELHRHCVASRFRQEKCQ
jgi:hypothetical protein